MAARLCVCGCGRYFEAATSRRKYFSSSCRARKSKGQLPSPAVPEVPASTDVGDALLVELQKLKVDDTYEGRVALGIARQLDRGTVQGAAYSSLSKELDRRVDQLRLKAEREDDPTKVVKGRLAEKRAAMAEAS